MTKEDIKQICQIYDSFRSERNTATIAYNSDDTFYEHVLATYKLSQSPLSSSLDGAANRQAALEQPYKWEAEQDGSFGVTPLFVMSNIRSAFKAGAKWMAEQGYTMETRVDRTPLNGPIGICLHLHDSTGFKIGDKVIVQIRKKDE